ncbi:ABC transporter permease [Planctomycetota bacterium]
MRWSGFKRIVKLGFKSLWLHRLRTTLTMLGIIFGVCSVIAMLAIGEGASQMAQDAIARLGSTNLIIETVEPPPEQNDTANQQQRPMKEYGLTYKDAESIRNTIPDVEVIVPVRELNGEARYQRRKGAVKIIGTIPWYPITSTIDVICGRFISSIDLHMESSVCVIDENVVNTIFGFDHPIGKDIHIQGNVYRVIGVVGATALTSLELAAINTSEVQSDSGTDEVGFVYIPISTARSRFSEINYSSSSGSGSYEKVELQRITVKVSSIDHVVPMRNIIDTLLGRLHEQEQDYRIVVPFELMRQAETTQKIFSVVLGSIAAISLIVGGIGIMNIMLATVSERTREIGIRRALGAKKKDIVIQFLSESLIITLCGGILGIALGFLLPMLVRHFANMPTIITYKSLLMAFGISGAIGVIFGLYPAYRAASMDPIESLRHE